MPKKYLTVNDVAKILGVTPLTVRNWDRSGRLTAHRNPINNYRLYKTEEVEEIMGKIESSKFSFRDNKIKGRKVKVRIEEI